MGRPAPSSARPRRAHLLVLAIMLGLSCGPATAAATLAADADRPGRLVLDHWPRDGWSIEQELEGMTILLRGERVEIALPEGDPAALHPALLALEAGAAEGGTALFLGLGCHCSVVLQGSAANGLSIDIVESRPPRGGGPAPATAPLPPLRVAPGGVAGPASADPDLAEVRRRLIAQIERAAEAGLITLADPGADRPPSPTPAPPAREPAKTAPPDARPARTGSSPPDAPAIRADGGPVEAAAGAALPSRKTSDRVAPPDRVAVATAAPGPGAEPVPPSCHPDTAFALPDPVRHPAPLAGAARHDRSLLGEFDRPRAKAVEALTRSHIALGLGREALGLLAEFGVGVETAPLLAAMAHIVEGETPAGPGLDGTGCDGAHALWQAMAAALAGAHEEALVGVARAGRALQTVPSPLRRRFAARIGLSAAERGDWLTAGRMLAMAGRGRPATDPPPVAEELLAARIARARGETATALMALRRVWSRFPAEPEAGEGLLALADLAIGGTLPDPGDTRLLRLDLGSLALTARGTALSERAIAAEAQLTALAYGPTAGVDLLALARRQGTMSEAAYVEAVRTVSARAPAGGGGQPLALRVERAPGRYRPVLADPAFRAALALSYAEIGRPERTERFLEPGDLGRPRVAAALARAYLAAGAPQQAEAIAARLPAGAERAEIMAAILEAGGEPARALALLTRAGAGTARDRARLAWAAGDWAAAAVALAEAEAAGPDREIAARLALARARATDAGTAAGSGPGFEPTREGVSRYLEALRAEAQTLRKVLEDG